MPIRRPTIDTFVRYHNSADSFLAHCQQHLEARERDANIILPFALKQQKSKFSYDAPSSSPLSTSSTSSPVRRRNPRIFIPVDSDTESEDCILSSPITPRSPISSSPRSATSLPSRPKDEQFWLSMWSGGRSTPRLDLVLSCTNGPIGKYPVFLYSNVSDDQLTPEFISPRIALLVRRLRTCVSSKRVFSVFGPDPLAIAFVNAWSNVTSLAPVPTPYYAAKHTYCTRSTLTNPPSPLPQDHELRLAEPSDLLRAADLCYGFASVSDPFFLSREDAIKEASGYIQNQQLYVYNINSPTTSQPQTASIVCVTRSSSNVSAITKVYTNPNYRGRKCAEILVRYVCRELLFDQQKNMAVLFVAHDNIAAEKVYDRVGFQGLCGKPRPEGVNDWIEIGFEGTELGHW